MPQDSLPIQLIQHFIQSGPVLLFLLALSGTALKQFPLWIYCGIEEKDKNRSEGRRCWLEEKLECRRLAANMI